MPKRRHSAQSESFVCSLCGVVCTAHRSLLRHYRTSEHCGSTTTRIPCSDPDCDKTFARNDNRLKHEQRFSHGTKRRKTSSSGLEPEEAAFQCVDPSDHLLDPQMVALPDDYREWTFFDDHTPSEAVVYSNCNEDFANPSGVNSAYVYAVQEPPYYDEQPHTSAMATMTGNFHTDTARIDDVSAKQNETSTTTATTSTGTSAGHDPSLRLRMLRDLGPIETSSTLHSKATQPLCSECRKPFETDLAALSAHVNAHVQTYIARSGSDKASRCESCQIDFLHQADLDYHLGYATAKRSSCGFTFPHHGDCSGHHPPPTAGDSELVEWCHKQMLMQSLEWERVQCKTSCKEYDEVLRRARLKSSKCGSHIGAAVRRSTRAKRSASTLTHKSTPAYIYSDARTRHKRDISISVITTSFTEAIESKQYEVVEDHLYNGADPNCLPGRRKTPLFAAVRTGDLDIVGLLLRKRANPNYIDPDFGTVLSFFVTIADQFDGRVRRRLLDLLLDHCDANLTGPKGSALDEVNRQLRNPWKRFDKKHQSLYEKILARMTRARSQNQMDSAVIMALV